RRQAADNAASTDWGGTEYSRDSSPRICLLARRVGKFACGSAVWWASRHSGEGTRDREFAHHAEPRLRAVAHPPRLSRHPLQRQRHALPDADAHGDERALGTGEHRLMRGRDGKPRARHPEWMAERDRAAVRIDLLGIVRQPELAQAGERLRGKRLIELDPVEVADLE